MAKSITIQRKTLKINSEQIRAFTEMYLFEQSMSDESMKDKTIHDIPWMIDVDWRDVKNKESVIGIGESHTLRMLDDIVGSGKNIRKEYNSRRSAIKNIKKSVDISTWDEDVILHSGKSIKKLHAELEELQFQENYISVVFENKKDFKSVNKNGLYLNGRKFKRLYGTSAGIKGNTIIYVCEEVVGEKEETIHEVLLRRLENGHDKTVPMVASKYEAYLSLNSSASTPVFSGLNADQILVVPDQVNNVKTMATLIGECVLDKPTVLENETYEFEYEQSDGGGIIDKEIADIWAEDLELDYTPSVFITRNSFCKGTHGVMDISELSKRFLTDGRKVYDIWNLRKPENERIETDMTKIKMIMPTSMLKLWKNYSSIDDYLKKCKENKHTFCVTKVTPKKLENERTLNYQFVQSLYLDDKDIDGLTKNTRNAFHDILKNDFRKTILYSKGTSLSKTVVSKSDNDCFKSIMIDERMMNDMHIKKTIYKMMRRSIDKAKIAKIKTRANYQMIIPDLVAFYKHSIGLDDTTGVLKEGEFYSQYWNDLEVDEVVAMRAPACTHANFRKLKFVKDRKDMDLLKHIKTAIVFNGHDSTAESLSGAD